jgi:hypothetical protein
METIMREAVVNSPPHEKRPIRAKHLIDMTELPKK